MGGVWICIRVWTRKTNALFEVPILGQLLQTMVENGAASSPKELPDAGKGTPGINSREHGVPLE